MKPNTQITIQKPLLKWVGGKTQMIQKILSKFPVTMNHYHEPFLGGGSVLFALLSYQQSQHITITGTIYAYDFNKGLIHLYKNIQSHKDEFYNHVTHYKTIYESIPDLKIDVSGVTKSNQRKWLQEKRKPATIEEAKLSKEAYYYWLRNRFNQIGSGKVSDVNKSSPEYSALFLLLNKYGFRGMYREGPNGMNIPFGNYKRDPCVITEKELNAIHTLIQPVQFKHCDCIESIAIVKPGDFVYLDPPYAPETKTSFVGYTADGFPLSKHEELFTHCKKMADKKIKFVMSNANVPLVREYFAGVAECEEIVARRTINSKKPGSKTTEVILWN